MATFVVKTSGLGSLQSIQIGPVDIVATVAAAHSAWGWIGGMNGIQNLLKISPNPSEEKRLVQLFKDIDLVPASCLVLAQTGLITVSLRSNDAFGNSLSSKLIGLTLCALGHNMRLDDAVNVFMVFFVDPLYRKGLSNLPGSKEALKALLVDNGQLILNAGVVHHLPEAFDEAIAALHIGMSRKVAIDEPQRSSIEVLMVEGFLKWVTTDFVTPYYTRSALVTRVAACLQAAGYRLDAIRIWDGCKERPAPQRSLILVTGGVYQTDHLMSEDSTPRALFSVSHYRWETVGALFWNACRQPSDHVPERFQQDFDIIDATVSHCLFIHWARMNLRQEQIQAFSVWKRSKSKPSHIATRIATILFPKAVDDVAMLYEAIASEKYLVAAKHTVKPQRRGIDFTNKEIQRFQTISAAICFAVLGQLAGRSFRVIQHSTLIDLSDMFNLNWLCSEVDILLTSGSTLSRVVTALATIHCAKPFPHVATETSMSLGTMEFESSGESATSSEIDESGSTRHLTDLVGWRNGRYAVLPELLFSLDKPVTRSVLGLRCTCEFIANIPTRRNGAVRCSPGNSVIRSSNDYIEEVISEDHDVEAQQIFAQHARPIILGSPRFMEPDKPLYLSLERDADRSVEPAVGLCGRLDGELLGSVNIHVVLAVIASSLIEADGLPYKFCKPGETHKMPSAASDLLSTDKVLNMPASRSFSGTPENRSFCDINDKLKYHRYIQVAGSTPWIVFLAGQYVDARIVFRCLDCAVSAGESANWTRTGTHGIRFLIGYQNWNDDENNIWKDIGVTLKRKTLTIE